MTEPLNLDELGLTGMGINPEERPVLELTEEYHYDHEVKSWPFLFQPIIEGIKTHDIRDKRDRDYNVGEVMLLREFDPAKGEYTGREARVLITYITDNVTPCAMSSAVLDRNFAVLSITPIDCPPVKTFP